MSKHNLPFEDGEYAPVADRIRQFYDRFPFGRIITHLVSRTEREVVFRAEVFRGDDDEVAATGWAAEREGDGEVNTVACLENTETSAIGRALANLGLAALRHRPADDEVRGRARYVPPGQHKSRGSAKSLSNQAGSAKRVDEALQQAADAVVDALALLAEAERAGFDPSRVAELRDALLAPDAPPSVVTRTERAARRWLAGLDDGVSSLSPRL